jgi:hypothetical protein
LIAVIAGGVLVVGGGVLGIRQLACNGEPVCTPPEEDCGGVCVNVAESSTSCGRCGHDCGGGACRGGKCQPVVVAEAADGLDQPAALAVNANAIFWTERTRVRWCPLPLGCALEPRPIADAYSSLDAIGVTDDAVYFTGCRACDDHHDLRKCPISGCPEPSPYIAFTTHLYEEILIGRTRAYWRDKTGGLSECRHADCAGTDRRWQATHFGGELLAATIDGEGDTVYVKVTGEDLRSCADATGCAAPVVVPNTAAIKPPFRVHAGRAYWLETLHLPRPHVRVCDLASCGAGTIFSADNPGSAELEVDDTGVYWINPAMGTLRHCPLAGCPPGGAAVLAGGRTGPKALTSGAGFVYWIEGNTIFKIAKPPID